MNNEVSAIPDNQTNNELDNSRELYQLTEVTEQQIEKIRQMMRFLVTKSYAEKEQPFENFSSSRADVLVNSVEVFLKKGIDDTTVQDLLDQSDVSRRTFYKYFKNKTEVVESVYCLLVNMLEARYREEIEQMQTPKELLDKCIDVFFDYQQALGPVVLMLNQRASGSTGALGERRRLLQKNLVTLMDAQIYRLQGIHYDPWIFYSLLWAAESALHHLLSHTQLTRQDVMRCKDSMKCIMGSVILRAEDKVEPLVVPLANHNDVIFS